MKAEYETLGWDLSRTRKDEDQLKWALSQWRLLAKHLMKDKKMDCLPDMGTDEGGSSTSFDWWMILNSQTDKLLA